MTLFKYLPKEYLNGFFSRGNLKIGTLHEYRKEELYGPAIGDASEGVRSTTFEIAGGGIVDFGAASSEASFLRGTSAFENMDAGAKIKMQGNSKFHFVDQSPNFYIFCTASEFDANVMKEFGGACFEIVHPEQFFKIISRAIRQKAKLLGTAAITYRPRSTDWKTPHTVHPGMLKDDKYAYQKEMRTAWSPLTKTISPLFIKVPEAIKYCRRIPSGK